MGKGDTVRRSAYDEDVEKADEYLRRALAALMELRQVDVLELAAAFGKSRSAIYDRLNGVTLITYRDLVVFARAFRFGDVGELMTWVNEQQVRITCFGPTFALSLVPEEQPPLPLDFGRPDSDRHLKSV